MASEPTLDVVGSLRDVNNELVEVCAYGDRVLIQDDMACDDAIDPPPHREPCGVFDCAEGRTAVTEAQRA